MLLNLAVSLLGRIDLLRGKLRDVTLARRLICAVAHLSRHPHTDRGLGLRRNRALSAASATTVAADFKSHALRHASVRFGILRSWNGGVFGAGIGGVHGLIGVFVASSWRPQLYNIEYTQHSVTYVCG